MTGGVQCTMKQQYECLSGPLEIVLNITNSCNLNCLHCFNGSSPRQRHSELTDEEFLGVVKEICAIKPYNVCFSGGEPLIRRKLLQDSSAALSSHGIRISLVTNGILLDESCLERLLKAGVKEVSISLDGIRQDTHELLRKKAGSFQSALNALELLKKSGLEAFEPAFTVTRFNADEFEDYVNYFESSGYTRLVARPLVLSGRAPEHKELLLPSIEQYRKVWRIVNHFNNKGSISLIFSDPISHIYSYIRGYPFYGIEMLADGGLIPSPYIPFRLGNVRLHTIRQYWDAGLPDTWSLPQMKQLVSCFNKSSDISQVYENALDLNSAGFDLIDNNLGR